MIPQGNKWFPSSKNFPTLEILEINDNLREINGYLHPLFKGSFIWEWLFIGYFRNRKKATVKNTKNCSIRSDVTKGTIPPKNF